MATLKPIFDAVTPDKLASAIKELSQRGFDPGNERSPTLRLQLYISNGNIKFSVKRRQMSGSIIPSRGTLTLRS